MYQYEAEFGSDARIIRSAQDLAAEIRSRAFQSDVPANTAETALALIKAAIELMEVSSDRV